jgi:hypothetical protein
VKDLILDSKFFLQKRIDQNNFAIKQYENPIKNLKQGDKRELDYYRRKCWSGKIDSQEDRVIVWTELLGVKELDVKSYLGQGDNCKIVDIEIIDKDVPRSLHELYPDEKEKVSILV